MVGDCFAQFSCTHVVMWYLWNTHIYLHRVWWVGICLWSCCLRPSANVTAAQPISTRQTNLRVWMDGQMLRGVLFTTAITCNGRQVVIGWRLTAAELWLAGGCSWLVHKRGRMDEKYLFGLIHLKLRTNQPHSKRHFNLYFWQWKHVSTWNCFDLNVECFWRRFSFYRLKLVYFLYVNNISLKVKSLLFSQNTFLHLIKS